MRPVIAGVVNRLLFGAESPRRLAVAWAGLTTLVGVRIALGPYRMLAGLPPALVRPVWFLSFLHGMPSLAVIAGVQVIGTLAAAGALASTRWRRAGFAVAWLALLVLAGLRSSRGKILHNDVLLLLACVPFLCAPVVVRGWRDRRPSVRYGWPLRTALVVVAGAYFFCGLSKLERSGLAWVTSDNVHNVFRIAARSGMPMFPGVARALAAPPMVGHLVAAVTLAFELSFVIVLFRPRARPFYAAAAVALHAGTWLVLGIDYWAWSGVALLVLVDWGRLGRGHAVDHPDLIADDFVEAQLAGELQGSR